MTRERFEYLFEQYKTNQLSQGDWEELRMAVREGGHDEWLQEDFWQVLESGGTHETWTAELEESLWQQILNGRPGVSLRRDAELPVIPNQGKDHSKIFPLRRVLRYSAAAAVLVIVALAWWFRPVSRHAVSIASTPVSRGDVHPGGDKAILTLSDGTRIELDSAQNGQIARQGAASFNKSNGILSVSFASHPAGTMHNNPGSGKTLLSSEAPGEAFISTPRGGQYQLILPDGSRVWLNSASSLRFPTVFKGKERAVELSGEGYFEIEKNAAMPFTVSVNHMKVRVLGTHFNTMAYADEKTINTTLLQGAVEVSEGDLTKRLVPGQQALLNSAGHQLAIGQADIQKTIAWKNGLFEFDHTDLATIMRQLARWYDIEIIYRITPDSTPLGGSISKNLGLTEVLDLLEANGINHFKIEGKKVFVLP